MLQQTAALERIRFSYSTPDQSFARRSVINVIETLGGRNRLVGLYDRYLSAPLVYDDFFDAAIELMELEVRYQEAQLAKVPADGPVLFIANHPYGVIDGLTLIWLARKARPDIKVLTHKMLCQAPEARAHLLPIDFSGAADAQANNVDSRKQALRLMREGGAHRYLSGRRRVGERRSLAWPRRRHRLASFRGQAAHAVESDGRADLFRGTEFSDLSAGEPSQLHMASVSVLLGDGPAHRQQAGRRDRRPDCFR
jgi:hypothetical protein